MGVCGALWYIFIPFLRSCQVWVYSDDIWVSPDEREEQEFGQRLAQAGVTDWIQ